MTSSGDHHQSHGKHKQNPCTAVTLCSHLILFYNLLGAADCKIKKTWIKNSGNQNTGLSLGALKRAINPNLHRVPTLSDCLVY